jgi:hypothetical protein
MTFEANNVNFLDCNGTTTDINTDINSSTSNASRTLTLESTNLTGSSNLVLKSRGTNTCTINSTGTGMFIKTENALPINFTVNNTGGTSAFTPLIIQTNGVVNMANTNAVKNKMVVLYEGASADDPTNALNFYGFGINAGTFRYQVSTTTNSFKFYCGTVISFTITNGVGNSGSDIRWKSEIEDITNALDIVNKIQGKSFKYQDCKGKQYGFIAQDILQVLPHIVHIDEETEDKYMYLQYDRFCAVHNEAIKELHNIIKQLQARIAELEKTKTSEENKNLSLTYNLDIINL